jgi:hypothetical protein
LALESPLKFIPDPLRGWLTVRNGRRWVKATAGAQRHNARMPRVAPTLNFWPHRPQPIAPIYQIMTRLGLRAGFDPRAEQPSIAWETHTWLTPRQVARLPENAINRGCTDISKTRVATVWEQVAGYPFVVDPLTTSGQFVAKPEANALHAGQIVTGPIAARRKGWSYQKLVDCRIDGQIHQMRAMVADGHLALAYEKWRPEPEWFQGTRISVPRTPDELFSRTEQELLLRFSAAINMDYGELDILRDEPTGKLYVVDANRTPTRPHQLPEKEWARVYDLQAEGFRALLAPWGIR